jgi:hypothetical protein
MVAAMVPANNVAKRDMFSSCDGLIALQGERRMPACSPRWKVSYARRCAF